MNKNKLALLFLLLLMVALPVVAQDKKTNRTPTTKYTKAKAVEELTPDMPKWYSEKARKLIKKGAWRSAKTVLDKGVETYSDDPNIRWLLGRYYEHIGDLNKARYNLLKCLDNDHHHINAKKTMVSVEEKSKHYSNALAYCNELLEVVPYEKTIWRKKIELYRLMHNTQMADRILARMQGIFPGDPLIEKDVNYQKELSYLRNIKEGSLVTASQELEDLIYARPRQEPYYQDLVLVYKRRGMYDKAINTCDAALAQFGNGKTFFIDQKVSMLCGQGRHQEALAFLLELKKTNSHAAQLYQSVADDILSLARANDPYESTAKQYEKKHSSDDLNYLLNTAVNKGYYDDAIYYIEEARKMGVNKNLLAIEYDVEVRAGHTDRANQLLTELYKQNPNDLDIVEKYGRRLLASANDEFAQQDYNNAIVHLNEAMGLGFMEADEMNSARYKILSSYIGMKDFGKAKQYLDSLNPANASDSMMLDAGVYTKCVSIYDEAMVKVIKDYGENENYSMMLEEAQKLLEVNPKSEAAFRYAINAADALNKNDLFSDYVNRAYNSYPQVPFFAVRKSIVLNREGLHEEALAILEEMREGNKTNTAINNAYIESCVEYGYELVKVNLPQEALRVCDSALEISPKHRELNYIKGLAYEKMKKRDLAYKYLMKYSDVSLAELPEFRQHMRGLAYKASTDKIDIEYNRVTSNNKGESSETIAMKYISSKASLAYTHSDSLNSYMARVDYNGVEGDANDPRGLGRGGTGYQGTLQWEHTFNDKWSAYINGSYANKYFNEWGLNLSASRNFKHDWTAALRLSYRKTSEMYRMEYNEEGEVVTLRDKYDLFMLTPSVQKTFAEKYTLGAQLDGVLMQKKVYYNASAKAKMLFTDDGVTSITLMGGFGSFPEINLFDLAAAQCFTNTNTMVALDAQVLLAKNLALGLTGTWYTNYNPTVIYNVLTTYYRNLFSLSLQLHVAL